GDWSSDVCSSDLARLSPRRAALRRICHFAIWPQMIAGRKPTGPRNESAKESTASFEYPGAARFRPCSWSTLGRGRKDWDSISGADSWGMLTFGNWTRVGDSMDDGALIFAVGGSAGAQGTITLR